MYVHLFTWEHMSVCMCAHECSETSGGEKFIWRDFLQEPSALAVLFCLKQGLFFLGLGLEDYSKLPHQPTPGILWSQPSGSHHHAQHSIGRFWWSNSGPLSTEEPQFSSLMAQESPGSKLALPLPPSPHLISLCPLFRPFLLASMKMVQVKLRLWLNISFQLARDMAAGT